ncbi:hypothetical protein EZV77_19455 [Burkholderia thailandensis]|uniref:hypothetical protein n=1 Tax=Burkholderia thailandensis TaxID=57975 RepID=UPI0009B68113|nr:hypothetical protein [Burkholderia thailandensis]TBW60235.1 hypothetical protein EZV77_19455 [Burkholderia thailandensis]
MGKLKSTVVAVSVESTRECGAGDAAHAPRARIALRGEHSPMNVLSLEGVNPELAGTAMSDFFASRSEAAFCQAGVVAPPDSLTGETRCDSGDWF